MCGSGSGVPCPLAQSLRRELEALTVRVAALEAGRDDE